MTQNRLERHLQEVLGRRCPSPHDLGEFELGLLASVEMQTIQGHVADCPHCQHELAELRQFLVNAEPPVLAVVADWIVEWAQGLMHGGGQAGLAGVRGADGRVRTFQVGDLLLSITLQERPDGLRDVLALVMRADGDQVETGKVTLVLEDEADRVAGVDTGGNAVLTGIPSHGCDLVIEAEGQRVRIYGVS
ncbi:MAG TPA: hypothetical protein VK191_08030 [Symbiobacteriaceae bacterium]|nr:hypothetical protein [Symbiobacteriaceae bacterium]